MAPPVCIIWLGLIVLSCHQTVTAFVGPRAFCHENRCMAKGGGGGGVDPSPKASQIILFSSPNDNDNDDWGLEDSGENDVDPRLDAMRSMLESSWDDVLMGVVPTDSEKAAGAAAESIADAMGQSKNVLMIDLRLPSYDIMEGPKLYNMMAAYDFCSFLSDNLRERKLIQKSLVLVRNEKERAEIDGKRSQREGETRSNDDSRGFDDTSGSTGGPGEESDVDDFRKSLMTSWDSTGDDSGIDEGSKAPSPAPVSERKVSESNSSHRLWSMVGNEEISEGPDMFHQVIAAADENAILSAGEDALIILSPYDTIDIVAVRRIMARYGQTRTIIIVNSRIETLPQELDPAVLVYGLLPLIARSKGDDVGNGEAGLKVVAMKRFPADWAVFVDVYGDGFVEAAGPQTVVDSSGKLFPPPEWIAQRVQKHVEGLSKQ